MFVAKRGIREGLHSGKSQKKNIAHARKFAAYSIASSCAHRVGKYDFDVAKKIFKVWKVLLIYVVCIYVSGRHFAVHHSFVGVLTHIHKIHSF